MGDLERLFWAMPTGGAGICDGARLTTLRDPKADLDGAALGAGHRLAVANQDECRVCSVNSRSRQIDRRQLSRYSGLAPATAWRQIRTNISLSQVLNLHSSYSY